MDVSVLKYYMRHTPLISKLYNKISLTINGDKFNYNNLPSFDENVKFVNDNRSRITLIVPNLNSDSVFGGLLTAIKIYKSIAHNLKAEMRIIVLSGKYNRRMTYNVSGFNYIGAEKNVLFVSEEESIDIRENDFFIGTYWTTVFSFMPVLQKQKKIFGLPNRKFIYLIQDFEPGFFPWSTEYVLANSTYENFSKDIVAVFNAKSLHNFFENKNYSFGKEIVFNPQLNGKLKKLLPSVPINRKKKILIYGRPTIPRNAFEIIKSALAMWSENYVKAKEWEIISLGASFSDIKLRNNIIKSYGKVSLEDYAMHMKTSYAGISLMISPHPSYPPLEMSTFGIKTITNSFENKDLSDFNPNIYNIDICTPQKICTMLDEICEEYYQNSKGTPYTDNDYVKGGNFEQAMDEIANYIGEMKK